MTISDSPFPAQTICPESGEALPNVSSVVLRHKKIVVGQI
jgi:hypothetical protein